MTDEATYHYPYPADDVFAAAFQVLTFGPMQLNGANPNARILGASTLFNMTTYGEHVGVYIEAAGPYASAVNVRSQLKVGMASTDRNRMNVELVHYWLGIYLSVKGARTPGWYADPFGRQKFRYFDGSNFLDQDNAPMFAPPQHATPAGWYPSPDVPNQQRYWDGRQWTEHTAPR